MTVNCSPFFQQLKEVRENLVQARQSKSEQDGLVAKLTAAARTSEAEVERLTAMTENLQTALNTSVRIAYGVYLSFLFFCFFYF